MKTYQLPQNWRNFLIGKPETGMGYQVCDIHFRDGTVLKDIPVNNCEIFYSNTPVDTNDVVRIDVTHNKQASSDKWLAEWEADKKSEKKD